MNTETGIASVEAQENTMSKPVQMLIRVNGNVVRKRMEEEKFFQKDVAELTGIDQGNLSKIINGRPNNRVPAPRVQKLADLLGVAVEDITEDMVPRNEAQRLNGLRSASLRRAAKVERRGRPRGPAKNSAKSYGRMMRFKKKDLFICYRASKYRTVTQVADAAGLKHSTVNRLFSTGKTGTDRAPEQMLMAIANALGVSYISLLHRKQAKVTTPKTDTPKLAAPKERRKVNMALPIPSDSTSKVTRDDVVKFLRQAGVVVLVNDVKGYSR